MTKARRDELHKKIKSDLADQLDRNCTAGQYYVDLIDDYMAMWDTKNLLIEDIQTRGVSITYDNGGGQTGTRKNDSVAELLKVNAQMLKLLSELGIKPNQAGGDGGDEM